MWCCNNEGGLREHGFEVYLFPFLLYSSARVQTAPVDRFWRSIRHITYFCTKKCLFGIESPKQYWGVNIGIFKPKSQNVKSCILSKLLHRFQVMENSKIQDGGGRHLKKSKYRHSSATVWSIATKFGTVTQYDPLGRQTVPTVKISTF